MNLHGIDVYPVLSYMQNQENVFTFTCSMENVIAFIYTDSNTGSIQMGLALWRSQS
jgi:hypothetical protein